MPCIGLAPEERRPVQGALFENIIKKEKCGIVIKSDSEIIPAIKKIFQNSRYNKNARKTAEKYFNKENIKKML